MACLFFCWLHICLSCDTSGLNWTLIVFPFPVLCISTLFPSILQRASPMQYIKDQKLSFSFPLSWTRRYLQYGVSPAEALTFFGFLHSCSRVFLWSGRLGHTIGLILKAENIHKLNKWQREKVHKYIVLFVWGRLYEQFSGTGSATIR